ncbi:MAG: hypothetical protein ACHQQ3_12325 [Gemmatimonadales bacterium]
MHGRAFGYLRYQLGDYLLQRAALPLVLVLITSGLPLWATLRRQPDAFAGPRGAMFAHQLFTGTVVLFLPLGAFFGGAGIISTDRQQGHFRFFFSKPVSVLAYYTQAYLLNGIVFVLLFGAITWGWGSVAAHESVPRAMEAAALTFILVGGLGFLFGALTRFDLGLLVVVYLVANGSQQLVAQEGAGVAAGEALPAVVHLVAKVFPPVYGMDQLRNHLYAGEALGVAATWPVVAYGVGAFILGAVLLRRLPLAR